MSNVFLALENILVSRLKKVNNTTALIELKGSSKVYLIHPDEINYLSTIKGFRSSIEFFGTTENFIIQDKMKNLKQLLAPYHYFNDLKAFPLIRIILKK